MSEERDLEGSGHLVEGAEPVESEVGEAILETAGKRGISQHGLPGDRSIAGILHGRLPGFSPARPAQTRWQEVLAQKGNKQKASKRDGMMLSINTLRWGQNKLPQWGQL